MSKLRAFIRYDGKGELVSSSLIVMQKKPAVGDWVEVPMHKTSNASPQLHTPFYRALIRYDSRNNIVPGTLIITRSVPSIGNWYEVPMKKQVISPIITTTTTTSTTQLPCYYNGELTVGFGFPVYYGYNNSPYVEHCGALSPIVPNINGLFWSEQSHFIMLVIDGNFSEVNVTINNDSYTLLPNGPVYMVYGVLTNPFSNLGEIDEICINVVP